jgi:Uma2 family endonuclease
MNAPATLTMPANASCTVLFSKDAVDVPVTAYTLSGFREWLRSGQAPEKARLSFLDGHVFVDMSGEDIQGHVLVKAAISHALYQLCEEGDLGLFLPDGAQVVNEAANVSNIPDAVFVAWDTLEAERARLITDPDDPDRCRELEGTPDWVLEVVSDSSVQKDTVQLRDAYHRAGIPEYWLVDARGEALDFQILVWRDAGYQPAPRRGHWQRSPTFARRFRLQRRRGRMGLWRYSLEVRATR